MKSVVTGTRGIPHVMGGVETHCEELVPRIASFGEDVTLIRRASYVNDGLTEWKGVKLVDIATPKKKSFEAIVHTFRAINNMDTVMLDDLVGYEIQKKKLVDNTEAFVQGKKANNVLLFGDSGTGKSTSIKAIVNQYYKDGLRMIEIYKHQFKYLSEIIADIKNRNYRFIIYMDDLSFEEFEIEYKFLKAVIEGGVETKPENILIYATSNRRHLIKESWNDRNDQDNSNDRHHSDTVEEKLSLVNRFGVTINYSKPTQKEYFDIVEHLARRAGVTMSDEQLRLEANKWELSHGGISGRTAEQFVSYLASQEEAFR